MKLLNPLIIGNQRMKNSMVMSAMTRSRANEYGVVGDLTTLYYW